MKIEIKPPYFPEFSAAYLTIGNDQRRIVNLIRKDGSRTSVSYARYQMSVAAGTHIPPHLEVDHIDNDPTNDSLDNYQLLTSAQNKQKQAAYYQEHVQEYRGYYCAACEISFFLTLAQVNKRISNGVVMAFCSRRCAAFYHSRNSEKKRCISDSEIGLIRSLKAAGRSSYAISSELNIARNTVMKYW